jgi:hypothetical protein
MFESTFVCPRSRRPSGKAWPDDSKQPAVETGDRDLSLNRISVVTSHSAITVGITTLYICTSNASSDQPPKQAAIVRRSRERF